MATPTLVTINFDFNPDAQVTQVTFRVPTFIRYNAGPDTIPANYAITATIPADGAATLQVYGTNDPAWSPANWNYLVTVDGPNLHYEFYAQVPYDLASIDFSALLPAQSASLGTLYAAFNHTHEGGGGGGGSVAWADITGKPSTFPPTLPIAQSGVANLTADLAGKASTGHTHTSAAITDFTEAVQDVVAGLLVQGSNVTLTYNDAGNTLTIAAAGGGGGGTAPTFARGYVTSGDVTAINDTSWVPVSGMTFQTAAVAGDNVTFTAAFLMDNNPSSNDFYDLVILVGGSIVRYASTGTSSPSALNEGDPALYPGTARYNSRTAYMSLTLTSGDLSGGNVTFGIAHKGAGGGKLYASANYPLRWQIRNDHQ